MSKISELDFAVKELRDAATSLNAVADSLSALFGKKAGTSSKEPEKPKLIKLEDIRAILAEKSTNGHGEVVRALISKFGASKLSEIKPEDYPALKAEAEVIGNG